MRALSPGTTLGPYTLHEELGRGGSGVVHRAEDARGIQVALKVSPRSTPSGDRRFLREFERLRTMRIPGVVGVYEAGVHRDLVWFSMDLVEGVPIDQALGGIEPTPKGTRELVKLGRQVLEILAALHQSNFVHRDIKPSNVFVDLEGRVRLLDFGIAHVFEDRETTRSTATAQQLLGTLPYMSPEQLAGLPLTPATDVFSTAVMLHEAVAGPRGRPANPFGWITRTCLESIPPLATQYREIPLGLSKALERMLRVDPRRRPSAEEAARMLRLCEAGLDPLVWPEPAFSNPGPWWEPLESAAEGEGGPMTWVLEGPAGSGRSRVTEQLERLALMQARWPIGVDCRIDSVGGAIEELLLAVLLPTRNEPWASSVLKPYAGLLRRVWPSLPLSSVDILHEPPDDQDLAVAVRAMLHELAVHQPLLCVVRHAEQVDGLTKAVLIELAKQPSVNLGLVVVHDPRWKTGTSDRLISALVSAGAGRMRAAPPSAETLRELTQSLCPANAPTSACETYLEAVGAGLRNLAEWRGMTFPTVAPPWPLALRSTPIPSEVLRGVTEEVIADNPWVRESDYGWVLESSYARTRVLARLHDLPKRAAALADAWQRADAEAHDEVASLRMLAGDARRAWAPALAAAERAVHRGRFAEARRWLQIIETLPGQTAAAYGLAALRAEVARVTDPGLAPAQLLARADKLAKSEGERAEVDLSAIELALGEGRTRSALVSALRLASTHAEKHPLIATRAWLSAARARLILGQLGEASRELARGAAMLRDDSPAKIRVERRNLEADIEVLRGDLLEARQRSRHALRLAAEAGNLSGVAVSSLRLARLLRKMGRRRQAEDYARAARDAFVEAGDLRGHAEACLVFATLAVERSDLAVARPLLDLALRRVRGLNMPSLVQQALVVSLMIATIEEDTAEAAVVIDSLDSVPSEESAAAVIRWWRTRGEMARALAVDLPPSPWGEALCRLQRAVTLRAARRHDESKEEAENTLVLAESGGFTEVALHARMLLNELHGNIDGELLSEARRSLDVELHLGAMATEARCRAPTAPERARAIWESLRERSRQLGYRPGLLEAEGWLAEGP